MRHSGYAHTVTFFLFYFFNFKSEHQIYLFDIREFWY